jgi:hypothetical protein
MYLDALARHDPSKLPTSKKVRFTENGAVLWLGEGLWLTAGPATDYRLFAVDPENGDVAVDTNITENGALVPFLVRLKVRDGKITEVETVLCRKGGSSFVFAPERLTGTPALYAAPVPQDQRESREELLRITDGYFTAITTEGTPGYKPAAFAPGANRRENGFQTTNVSLGGRPATTIGEQLDKGMFKGVNVVDRRYPVVDREYGIVLGVVRFAGTEGAPATGPTETTPQTPIVSEMFKVTGGQIQEVRAVMVTRPADAPSGWK